MPRAKYARVIRAASMPLSLKKIKGSLRHRCFVGFDPVTRMRPFNAIPAHQVNRLSVKAMKTPSLSACVRDLYINTRRCIAKPIKQWASNRKWMWNSPVSLHQILRFPHLLNPKIPWAIKQFTNVNRCSCLRPPCCFFLIHLIVCLNPVFSGYFPRGQTQSHFCLCLCLRGSPQAHPSISDLSPTSGQHYQGSIDVSSYPWLDPLTPSGREKRESG